MAGKAQLFEHDLRKDGRRVVLLRGVSAKGGGVTVEAEVHPVTSAMDAPPQVRPFAFSTAESAKRFVDEALLALQYLGCDVVEPLDE
jgi:hypothetical protein